MTSTKFLASLPLQALLALLALLVLLGCGDGGTPTSSTPESAAIDDGALGLSSGAGAGQTAVSDLPFRRILCFGDSVTYGVTLDSLGDEAQGELALVEGYVPKLWRRLEEKYGTGFELVNAGIGGERTTEGVERIRYEMNVHDPEVVLLLEGVVDINNPAPRFPVVRENLAEIMRLVQRDGRLVIIGTYPLLDPEGFRISGAEFVPRLNDVIRQEANKQDVVIADHERATDLTSQGPDGLHPNNIGYEAIADTWLAALEELAAKLGGT